MDIHLILISGTSTSCRTDFYEEEDVLPEADHLVEVLPPENSTASQLVVWVPVRNELVAVPITLQPPVARSSSTPCGGPDAFTSEDRFSLDCGA